MIIEGKARIIVEDVFYNPRMKFCRDADMEVFRNLNSKSYLDALSASGVRGIRAKLEAGFDNVEFNDISRKAVEVIRKNLELNGISAMVHNRDASALMRERKYDHVDLDPFGSPAEFIDSACFSAKKYLSITATDTSALCGSATISGLRKYSSFAEKTEYYHEIGLRMLIGKAVREMTKYDKYTEVLISWAKEHYYRIHLRLGKSSNKAGKMYEEIGHILHCWNCGRREALSLFETPEKYCSCGSEMKMYGPLWIGKLHSRDFVGTLEKSGEIGKLFSIIENEVEVLGYYDLHNLTKMLRISPPSLDSVIEALRDQGFQASRTRFGGTSFKTDAEIEDVKELIKGLSKK